MALFPVPDQLARRADFAALWDSVCAVYQSLREEHIRNNRPWPVGGGDTATKRRIFDDEALPRIKERAGTAGAGFPWADSFVLHVWSVAVSLFEAAAASSQK